MRALPLADKLLLSYVAIVCAVTFIFCLTPPSGSDYDGLTYHLAAPQRYLQAGRIVELPYDHHSYFPFTVEMWFLLGLALKGPVLAKLFHWMCLPLGCAVLWAFGRRHLGVRAGSYAAALWASLPVVQGEATTAYVDLGFTLWVLLAFGCLANWHQEQEARWLGWAGVFAGFALGSKYLGALTVAFIGVYALGRMLQTKRVQLKPLLTFSLAALFLGGGWYLRNAMWTGNPVFPFAYGAFGGKGWTPQMAQAYAVDQSAFGFGRGIVDFLLAPWRLSMTPLNSLVMTPRGMALYPQPFWPLSAAPLAPGRSGLFEVAGLATQIVIGPMLLAFGLPAAFMKRKPALVAIAFAAIAFFGAFWFATGQYLRYLLPAFALLCWPCGWMLAHLQTRAAFLRVIAGTSLAAWLLFALALTTRNALPLWPVVSGQRSPDEYLRRTFAPYDAMQWLNKNAQRGKVAVYGEPRCFYLRAPYFWADQGHNTLIDYSRVKTGEAFAKALRAQGSTHVMWQTDGPFGPPRREFDAAVQSGLLRPVYEAHRCQVFAIAPAREAAR